LLTWDSNCGSTPCAPPPQLHHAGIDAKAIEAAAQALLDSGRAVA
jgi:hypothetical protein